MTQSLIARKFPSPSKFAQSTNRPLEGIKRGKILHSGCWLTLPGFSDELFFPSAQASVSGRQMQIACRFVLIAGDTHNINKLLFLLCENRLSMSEILKDQTVKT